LVLNKTIIQETSSAEQVLLWKTVTALEHILGSRLRWRPSVQIQSETSFASQLQLYVQLKRKHVVMVHPPDLYTV